MLPALSEDITLKVRDGQDDQEILKELCEAYAAAHSENSYTFRYGVVGTADASARYPEDPAGAADVFVYPDDQLIRLDQADALYEVTRNHDAIVAANSQDRHFRMCFPGEARGFYCCCVRFAGRNGLYLCCHKTRCPELVAWVSGCQ